MRGDKHRQIYKPIRTHSESIAGWLVAILIGLGCVLAIAEWWTT
jgi:hypothetical protein